MVVWVLKADSSRCRWVVMSTRWLAGEMELLMRAIRMGSCIYS